MEATFSMPSFNNPDYFAAGPINYPKFSRAREQSKKRYRGTPRESRPNRAASGPTARRSRRRQRVRGREFRPLRPVPLLQSSWRVGRELPPYKLREREIVLHLEREREREWRLDSGADSPVGNYGSRTRRRS